MKTKLTYLGCLLLVVATAATNPSPGNTVVINTQVQASSDLQNWVTVTNVTVALPYHPEIKQIFYRAVLTQSITNR